MSPVQVALAAVVAVMWATSFFIKDLDATARVGAQAAMMTILGALFGVQLVRRNGNNK